MPLTVNVGLARKQSRNYQSTGASINLTAELDQSLLARPAELQAQIHHLYTQAEIALERQAATPAPAPPAEGNDQLSRGPSTTGATGGNGHTRTPAASQPRIPGNGRNITRPASMTVSQRRAIESISQRLDLDPRSECQQVLRLDLDQLTVRQASQLIDHLKGLGSDQRPISRPRGGA